ncbi:hypothetical protein HanIR_Chr10g0498001 [Helianthus annuus]|nr:hypothetical protein HanIR_Chr10g0498001 [Helianthus annuus]
MRAVQATTERCWGGMMSWAESRRSSLEYMFTRWLQRNVGKGRSMDLIILAWVARPTPEERVEMAVSRSQTMELIAMLLLNLTETYHRGLPS